MYKKIIFLIALIISQPFALTLEQIKTNLKEYYIPKDSIEVRLRVTVKTLTSSSQTDMHIVNKGTNKSYMEIKSSFLNQRSIVNGDRMKIVDLASREYKIVHYNGEPLKEYSYGNFNPLDSGKWNAPKYISQDLYLIEGDAGSLFYNSKRNRIEKTHSIKNLFHLHKYFKFSGGIWLSKKFCSPQI